MVLTYKDAKYTDLGDGCERRILIHSGSLMLV